MSSDPSIQTGAPSRDDRRVVLNWIMRLLLVLPFGGANAQSSKESVYANVVDSIVGKDAKLVSSGVILDVPAVAENGALVPVGLNSERPVLSYYLVAQGNPGPLLAEFHLAASVRPRISLRVKLNQSGPVELFAKTKDGWHYSVKDVRVAIGGCG
jgi:sulfur-oxidizing protein SoxY